MKEKLSYKDLDNVLDLLWSQQKGNKDPLYPEFHELISTVYSDQEADILINKLMADKLVKQSPIETKDNEPIILITFEGMLKLQENGYMGKLNKENGLKEEVYILP